MQIKSRGQLYFFLAMLAVVITTVLYFILPLNFSAYAVSISKGPTDDPNPETWYHDFDHDGESERLVLKNPDNMFEPALKVYTHHEKLIAQWNFSEKWNPACITFGDYNGDNYDEAYCFTQKADSLFLYILDPRFHGEFLQTRVFLLAAPEEPPSPEKRPWEINFLQGGFMDTDDDGYQDLVFSVMTGMRRQPRKFYVYSPRLKKIVYTSPESGAHITSWSIEDIDGDKQPEIITRLSSSVGNIKDRNVSFKDDQAWLMVFDKQLNFKFNPIGFEKYSSTIMALFSDNNFYVLTNHIRSNDILPSISIITGKGEITARKDLTMGTWKIVKESKHPGSRIFLINQTEGIIYTLAANTLEAIPYGKIEKNFVYVYSYDFNGDHLDEHLFRLYDDYLIYNSDFTTSASFKLGGHIENPNISIKKVLNAVPFVSFQFPNNHYLFSYQPNILYTFRLLILFFALILVFLFLMGNFHIFNILISYTNTIQNLVHNPRHGILVLDNKKRIKQFNRIFLEFLELKNLNIKGKNLDELQKVPLEFLTFMDKLAETQTKNQTRITFQRADGTFHGEINGTCVQGLLGFPSGFMAEIVDYSDTIKDERKKLWSQTVQKMAHDIKTPLSSIALNLSMVKMKLKDWAPKAAGMVEQDLEIMLSEMERVREMTRNFLKFTNLEHPNLAQVALRPLINKALEKFNVYTSDNLKLELEFNFSPDIINADESQLLMVFNILLENALDATKGDGYIKVIVHQLNNVIADFNDFVEISFCDTGTGIPDNEKEKIFEPYFTTKKDGTGMGLAIAKKIIEDHDGKIELFSRDNFASVFRIMLPVR
ncbi:MAG: GHKL domain-containing protein [Calditrichae bacterium]|nr:GHKL domain-containing protein [Calditrichia bacterium]